MKKILVILSLLAFFGGLSLQAAPVSRDRALDIAKKVFAAQPATKAVGDVKLIWDGEDVATKAAVNPAFYVFTRDGGGFVIIAGDDNVTPVLALSDHNEFKVEGMPENVKWWMDYMKAYVRTSVQTPEVMQQWASFIGTKSGPITGTVTDKVEKITPEWDQGNNDDIYFNQNVFNAKCPMIGSDYCVTGCVAAALGEVITYQSGQTGVSMPSKGTGTVGGYTLSSAYVAAGYVAPAAYALGTVYDWPNLRTLMTINDVLNAKNAGKNELLDNLAQLLADLGAMVEASYNIDDTGAVTSNAIPGLGEHLGFNKAAYSADAADYTPSRWIAKLKAELDQRPLVFSGRTSGNAGHAFVLDGYGKYDGNDVFHVNFGWGGMNNGYYLITNLDAGSGHNYSYNTSAIFDFYPKEGSDYTYALQYHTYSTLTGLSFIDAFSTSNWFRISLSLCNSGNTAYDGLFQAKLVDRTGTPKADFEIRKDAVLGWTDEFSMGTGSIGYTQLYLRLSSNPGIAFGDRIVIYCSTTSSKTDFQPIQRCTDGTVINELSLVPTAFIRTAASYNKNDWFVFELINNDYLYAGTVWTITDPDGTQVVKQQSDKEFQFTKKGQYKIEAATATTVSGAVIEKIVTYITVN